MKKISRIPKKGGINNLKGLLGKKNSKITSKQNSRIINLPKSNNSSGSALG